MADRKRREQRQAQRDHDKLVAAREKLASLEPGGSPARPIDVASASIIEPRASSQPCLRCEGPTLIADHEAATHEGRRLRVVTTRCQRCGSARKLYFALASAMN